MIWNDDGGGKEKVYRPMYVVIGRSTMIAIMQRIEI